MGPGEVSGKWKRECCSRVQRWLRSAFGGLWKTLGTQGQGGPKATGHLALGLGTPLGTWRSRRHCPGDKNGSSRMDPVQVASEFKVPEMGNEVWRRELGRRAIQVFAHTRKW